jgi:hypothetical protein
VRLLPEWQERQESELSVSTSSPAVVTGYSWVCLQDNSRPSPFSPTRFARPLVTASRAKWRELESEVVSIEDQIDAAVQAAVRHVTGREYFARPSLDVLLAGGTTPHAVPSVDPAELGQQYSTRAM